MYDRFTVILVVVAVRPASVLVHTLITLIRENTTLYRTTGSIFHAMKKGRLGILTTAVPGRIDRWVAVVSVGRGRVA